MMPTILPRQNGFTLVELLAAMVGAALLLFALGGYVAVLTQRIAADHQYSAVDRTPRGQAALAALVRLAIPSRATETLRTTARRIAFPIRPPSAIAGSEILYATIQVSDAETHRLEFFVAHAPNDAPIDGSIITVAQSENPIILVGHIRTQPDGSRLLSGVDINFGSFNIDAIAWHFAAEANAESSCTFDPISMACRP